MNFHLKSYCIPSYFNCFKVFFMARFDEADARLFKNVWICMRCNAKNRSPSGKPRKCRKCGSVRLRLKHKAKKSAK